MSLVEARGQGPAYLGRPLPQPAQPLLPSASVSLPRSLRWAGGHWMTAAEPRPNSPSPPLGVRVSPAQLTPGGRLNSRAPRATRLAPSPPGRPLLQRVGSPGLEPGRREGAREQQAATRKRHIRSRKDPPPEQPLFGQRLIWSGPIWPGSFRLWEEGKRRRQRGGGNAGNSEAPESQRRQLRLEH